MGEVIIITTGGTIAMKKDAQGKSLPAVSGEELLQTVPGLNELAATCRVIEFSNFASCNMKPEVMGELSLKIQACFKDHSISGIVVTHGTDTIEETAFFLELTVPDERPIILTAAQRDASEFDTDGPRNIKNAIRIAIDHMAKNRGVMVSLNEEINSALHVAKNHTCNVSTFSSGPYGIIGYCDQDKIRWFNSQRSSYKFRVPEKLPKITPLMVFTGMTGDLIDYAIEQGSDGIVLEAFGRGNVPPELEKSIKKTCEKGIPVVITSRCHNGRVLPVYSYQGGSSRLKDMGCIFSEGISTPKARLLLALALSETKDFEKIQDLFLRISTN